MTTLRSSRRLGRRGSSPPTSDGGGALRRPIAAVRSSLARVPTAEPPPSDAQLDAAAAASAAPAPAARALEEAFVPASARALAARWRAPTSSRWLIFAIASMALFMSSVDGTIVATGIPTLRRALHTQINWVSWTMTAYQLGVAVAMPLAGRISDHIGRKRVFVIAACVFTLASLLCGLADSIAMLIALRVLQAFGGAAFMPSASGMVVDAFGEQRNRALGLFSSIFPLGAMVGPILGGVIISDWSWRGIFLVNVPIGVLFTLLAFRYFPAARTRRASHADLVGAALLGVGILALMASISHLGDRGASFFSLTFIAPFAVAVGCAWWFVRRSDRVENPLIPTRLLLGRAFGPINLINLIWGGCAIGFGSLVPLFAEERYGLSPLSAGTLLTARAIGEVGLAILASMLLHRTGYRLPMMAGMLIIALGLVLIAFRPAFFGPYGWLAAAAALTGVGIGISAPAANNATIELAPDDVGAITGLRGASRQIGAIIAVAIATAVVARSSNEAATLGHAFVVLALLLVLTVPVVLTVPERRRAGERPERVGAGGH